MTIFKNKHLISSVVIITAVTAGFFAFRPSLDQSSQAQKLKTFCIKHKQKDQSKEECYYQEFKKVTKKTGHIYAFQTLAMLQKIDIDAQGCHLISHGIGSGAYDRDPNSWQNLINSLSPECSYGAIHGVIEKYVGSLPDKKLTKEIIPNICGPNPRADCNHIIGPLALVETRGNIDEGLELCQVFIDDRQREFCLTGVFMEYQTALNLIDHGYAPKSWLNWPARVPELEKVCRAQTGENEVACWKEIVHAALVKFRNDPQKIFDFCSSAQTAEGATECKYHAIGIMATARRFDLDALKPMCSIPQKEPNFKGECYVRLASSTLSTLPAEKDKVASFCRGLDEKYQRDCLYQVFGIQRQIIHND